MDRRIGYLLKRVQAGLRRAMDRTLAARGLTTPQYSALSALQREPGISNADLARRAFVTPQTMIRIVENLENLGFVSRSPHPTHGNVLMARLTPAGSRVVILCHADVEVVERHMLQDLGESDSVTLQRLLETCAKSLDSQR